MGISWRTESGLLFTAQELCSVLPLTNRLGIGIFNQVSAAIGYASAQYSFSVGPSISIYSMPACGAALCGRVVGLSPGGHAGASFYFTGLLGVAIDAHATWVGGGSLVLPGGVVVLVVAGPVLRWRSQ
jgi:hypothetical protein